MKRSNCFLSEYVTLQPSDLMRRKNKEWTRKFPFSSPSGLWTFSGRVALYAGLRRLGPRENSTILMPSYFQGSEVDTLLLAGFKLRFYRIDHNFKVDISDIEARFDGDVSALYVIHYFGLPQQVRFLSRFCKEKGIAFIEDCALSLFSRDGDIPLGSSGDMALFCVYKSLPLPHGGFLVSKEHTEFSPLQKPPFRSTLFQTADLGAQYVKARAHSALMDRLWSMTSRSRRALVGNVAAGSIDWDPKVLKFRAARVVPWLMDRIDADEAVRRRQQNFTHLHGLLADTGKSAVQELPNGACPLFYPLFVGDKPRFKKDLHAKGIGSVNLWSVPHPAVPEDMAKETDPWRRHILELPIHQQLDYEDIERIGKEVLSLLTKEKVSVATSLITPEETAPKGKAAALT